MKPVGRIWLAVPLLGLSLTAFAENAPVAGTQPLGITIEETAVVAKGWSGKKDILNKTVYNDKGDKIGVIKDVIIAPDRAASFAIIGTGGFVDLGKHDVAIPFAQLRLNQSRIELPGATKEMLKSLPEFVYAK